MGGRGNERGRHNMPIRIKDQLQSVTIPTFYVLDHGSAGNTYSKKPGCRPGTVYAL